MTLTRALLGLLAVCLLALVGHLHVSASAAQDWSSVTGVVVASYVRKTGAGNAGEAGDTDTYSPVVRYEYRVGSDPFANAKIGFGDFFYNWYSAKARVNAFPKGSNVTVYYDPREPGNSVLDKAYPSVAIAMLFGVVFLCLAIALFLPRIAHMALDALVPQRQKNA